MKERTANLRSFYSRAIKPLVLVGAISVSLLGGSFGLSSRVAAETTISAADARAIIDPILSTPAIIEVQKDCLKFVGGTTFTPRLEKMFFVAAQLDHWDAITFDISDWLANGVDAASRKNPTGFLHLNLINQTGADIEDFVPGVTVADGEEMKVSLPGEVLGILRGCIMDGEGERKIKNAIGQITGGPGVGQLNTEIEEYRAAKGTGATPETGTEEPIDVTPVRPTGTASTSTSGAQDSLSKIYRQLTDAISLLSILMGAILVASTIYAGIQYTTAGADSSKVSKAKSRLTSNVLVLAIYLFSATILNWILPG